MDKVKPNAAHATPAHDASTLQTPQDPTQPTRGAKQTNFKVGEHVDHPAAKDGSFQKGTGVVSIINRDGSYTVKCDGTGADLKQTFTADELTHR